MRRGVNTHGDDGSPNLQGTIQSAQDFPYRLLVELIFLVLAISP